MVKLDPIFLVSLIKGKLFWLKQDEFEQYAQTLPDGTYEIILRKPKELRSIEQNAYFHGVIVKLLADHTGHPTADIKDLLKTEFLKKEIVINNKVYTIIRHTANLSKAEFEEFTRQCREFGDTLGIYIPLPNEVDLSRYQ
jgi:hypothetical protein